MNVRVVRGVLEGAEVLRLLRGDPVPENSQGLVRMAGKYDLIDFVNAARGVRYCDGIVAAVDVYNGRVSIHTVPQHLRDSLNVNLTAPSWSAPLNVTGDS